MSLLVSVAPWALLGLLALLFWKLARNFILPSPLDKIPGPASHSWTDGCMADLTHREAWPFLEHLSNDYGQVVQFPGRFGKRTLWVFDPKALHHVIVKDQASYDPLVTGRKLSTGPGLLATLGDHHRRQRKLLNPVFSIAHMRRLMPVFSDVVNRLQRGMQAQLKASHSNEVDVLNWMGRTALELIGQGGFGHSFDALVENTPNAYADAVKDFVPSISQLGVFRYMLLFADPVVDLCAAWPALGACFSAFFRRVPHAGARHMKNILDVLNDTSVAIYEEKRAALASDDAETKMRVLEGRDLMSVMLRENMSADAADRLPAVEIIAQLITFTFAGTDTTSNALARILHLLCLYPDVQEKLRAEVLEARAQNGSAELDYDTLVGLPYLDAVCRETLRLYPPVAFVNREATQDTVLPLSTPLALRDGRTTDTLHIPKGTNILVGIWSSNRSTALWGADAREWKPARWLDGKLPEAVADAHIPGVYSNLMTFIGGGRACIGFKFSQLEMKVVLAMLVSSFRFSLCEGKNGEIVWNRAGIAYPSVGNSRRPSLPLCVEPLNG
ncbi:cytochrome P450 [Phanerochaete sordida]|uniref:Cytochrome P450 n=1 Tax=Phanerochaete sordida TaxID=48140 RepID=A0A9P3GM13_9APHY|nr:cytochrome P450 [Phanerochaete sordida]